MIKIYGLPISVHVRKVIVAAIYKGIDFENVPVFPFDPPVGWRDLSPTGQIPALTDGAFSLADSSAITHYLDVTYGGPRVIPEDPQAMAKAMFFDAYAGQTLFRDAIHTLFFQHKLAPAVLKQPTDQEVVDKVLAGPLPQIFRYLNEVLESPYLLGSTPCIADLAITSNLINYNYLGYRVDKALYPALAGYFDRMGTWAPITDALVREAPFAEQFGLDDSWIGR